MVAPRQWPAARVEMRRVEDLRPYPRNARRHSPQHVDQIAASIQQWGWTIPLLVDESGELIAGHGRLLAAKQLGLDEVPTMVARGWSEAQRRAYVIADNQLTIAGDWDAEALKVEVRELDALGVDVGLFAFEAGELDKLLGRDVVAAQQLADADAPVDELDLDGLGVEVGDVWQCGPHRVLCGDSTDAEQVARLFDGERAELVHADPPYDMGKESDGVANDNLRGAKLDDFQSRWLRVALANATPLCSVYVWGLAESLWRWWLAAQPQFAELKFRQELVWAKGTGFGITSGEMRSYAPEIERCLCFQRGRAFFDNTHDHMTDVWQFTRVAAAERFAHATPKPVAMVARALKSSCPQGGLVFEPFLGSGSTLIAAEATGRRCFGVELQPRYAATTIRRWELHTGQKAIGL